MVAGRTLDRLDGYAGLVIAFCMGFVVGTRNPDAAIVWPAIGIGLCALAKLVIYQVGRRQQSMGTDERASS
jgi:heme exporter protein D